MQKELERNQELKEQQTRLKSVVASGGGNKKYITYDYEGHIMAIQQIKLEKLPQIYQQMAPAIGKNEEYVKRVEALNSNLINPATIDENIANSKNNSNNN